MIIIFTFKVIGYVVTAQSCTKFDMKYNLCGLFLLLGVIKGKSESQSDKSGKR